MVKCRIRLLRNFDRYFGAGCSMFEFISGLYTIFSILAFLLFFCRNDVIWLALAGIIGTNFWHWLAFLTYTWGNMLVYEDECNDFRSGSDRKELCAEDGPRLAIVVQLFISIFGIFQCLFICIYYSKKKDLGITMK